MLRETIAARLFGFFKIPMLFYARPIVVDVNEKRAEVKIPFRRRNKNHLNSMYFGALCIGVDMAAGLLAMAAIKKTNAKISLIFKDFQAEFLKRVESDAHFVCEQGAEVEKLIQNVLATSERQNLTLSVIAYTPKISGQEPVARFTITLSLKKKD